MTATFSVRNFERFQHYKDRSPPWIKLYNELLDDYGFGLLPDASKLHLVAIWLLASRSDNRVPHDPQWIAMRINATEPVDLDLLAKAGFIAVQDASDPPAPCQQDACPERETETEAKTEAKTEEKESSADADVADAFVSDGPVKGTKRNYPPAFEGFWHDYPTDPLMSKLKAFERWGRLSLADRAAAHAALPGFRAHCAKDTTYRPVHAERFLSQRRFDGFVEAAAPPPPMSGGDDGLRAAWGGNAAALVEAIGPAKFVAWFACTDFDAGPPVTITVGKSFAAKWIREHYAGDLKRLYGEFRIEVKG